VSVYRVVVGGEMMMMDVVVVTYHETRLSLISVSLTAYLLLVHVTFHNHIRDLREPFDASPSSGSSPRPSRKLVRIGLESLRSARRFLKRSVVQGKKENER
jgi:hypothetical protein